MRYFKLFENFNQEQFPDVFGDIDNKFKIKKGSEFSEPFY